MKLLFFTSKPIFPSVDGGCFASYQFLKCLLNVKVDVQYATLSTNKHPFDRSQFPLDLAVRIQPIDYFVNTDVRVIPALKSLFSSRSYNADRFYLPEVETLLVELVQKNHFDGIIFDSLYTLPYLNGIKPKFKGKIAVRTHNVEFRLWEQYANGASGIKKWYLKRLAKDLKRFEQEKLNQVDAIFSISKDDSTEFQLLGIIRSIIEAPVTLDAQTSDYPIQENCIYHLGMMDWEPNQQAVQLLVEWMPEIRKRLPKLELHIAGSKSEEFVNEDVKNGIHVHGFVDSVEEFVKTHGILVSPIQTASGVRIKFLEAMAMGVPIITTSIGALGIDHSNHNCLAIAETKEDFISKIIELSSDSAKREEIGRNARIYIEKNHNIDTISQRIVEIFEGKS